MKYESKETECEHKIVSFHILLQSFVSQWSKRMTIKNSFSSKASACGSSRNRLLLFHFSVPSQRDNRLAQWTCKQGLGLRESSQNLDFDLIPTKDIFTLKACKMHFIFLKMLKENVTRGFCNVSYQTFQADKIHFTGLQS